MKSGSNDHPTVVALEYERSTDDPNSTRNNPGAFHIGGSDIRDRSPLNLDQPTGGSLEVNPGICEGRVLVLDGVVVQPHPPHKRKYLTETIGIISVITLVVVFVLVVKKLSNTSSEHPLQDIITFSPTMSPSLSSQPTTYAEAALREIIISISGEEKLNDPTTPLHYCFIKLIENIPHLEEMLIMDQKNRLIQRYVILLVTLSFSSDFKSTYELQLDRRLPNECSVFDCNEKEEITAFVFQNEWS